MRLVCAAWPTISIRTKRRYFFEHKKVDLKAKKTQSSADFVKINPKGHVPALTWIQNAAILDWISHQDSAEAFKELGHTHLLEDWLTSQANYTRASCHSSQVPTTRQCQCSRLLLNRHATWAKKNNFRLEPSLARVAIEAGATSCAKGDETGGINLVDIVNLKRGEAFAGLYSVVVLWELKRLSGD